MSDQKFEIIDVGNVRIVKRHNAAFLVDSLDGGPKEVWIPFSQIKEGSEITKDSEEGDEGDLSIPRWLADENGF